MGLTLVVIEATIYARYYSMKAHYYTNVVEGGHTFQADILIKESTLNKVIW